MSPAGLFFCDIIILMENYELLITAGLGLAVLLFGYRIKKIAFFIVWFILGWHLMTLLLPNIMHLLPEVVNTTLYKDVLLPIAGGVLMGMLGFTVEKLCVSLICFFLVMAITVQYFGTDWLTLAIGAIVGAIAGGVAVQLMKPAIILATAGAGSYAITTTILVLASLNQEGFYFPLLIGIAVIGAIFQFSTTKRSS